MMKQFCFFFSFVAILSLQSCITDHYLRKQNKEKPSAFSAEALNGNYPNYVDKDSSYESLWRMLSCCRTTKPGFTPPAARSTVALDYDGKEKLRVVLMENGIKKDSLELKVKRKGDYLSVHRSLFLIPIPILFYIHRENKMLLSMQGGMLNVNFCHLSRGWILMAASADYDEHLQFKKRE
jgi:hypothetical protein